MRRVIDGFVANTTRYRETEQELSIVEHAL